MKLKLGPLSIGLCRYERCIYYEQRPHPKTGSVCAFGRPACRLGKADMIITMQLAVASVNFIYQVKSLQCKLSGHIPYDIPAPPRIKRKIIACRRCGKKLSEQIGR